MSARVPSHAAAVADIYVGMVHRRYRVAADDQGLAFWRSWTPRPERGVRLRWWCEGHAPGVAAEDWHEALRRHVCGLPQLVAGEGV